MPHATPQQVLDAFERLDDRQLAALGVCARKCIDETGFSHPRDLIHEALHRALDGRRRWPLDVEFGLFMALAMRSIAYGDRKRRFRDAPGDAADILRGNESGAGACRGGGLGRSPAAWLPTDEEMEERARAERDLEALGKAVALAKPEFANDPAALDVLDAMLRGFGPTETCKRHGMNFKRYDAARQRVLRRLRTLATQFRAPIDRQAGARH